MEGGGRKINLSIIDLPWRLSRAKQMKCIGRNRLRLRLEEREEEEAPLV